MNKLKLATRRVSFESVEAGEFFQWGSRDGEVYVKIMVEKHRQLTSHEKKEGKSIYDMQVHNRYVYNPAALNIRTCETCYDISGGNIQCVRLKGYICAEVHEENSDD